MSSVNHINRYARLTDRFGDHGIVSAIIGEIDQRSLYIRVWVMSCRVLKRDLEKAIFDEIVTAARNKGIDEVYGEYRPTARNDLVRHLYKDLGFDKVEDREDGATKWVFNIPENCSHKNNIIQVDHLFTDQQQS